MHEQYDRRLHDIVALDEIDLYGDVLSAVAASDRPLTAAELDQVLGIRQEYVLPGPAPALQAS